MFRTFNVVPSERNTLHARIFNRSTWELFPESPDFFSHPKSNILIKI